jgi:hypothetical protein
MARDRINSHNTMNNITLPFTDDLIRHSKSNSSASRATDSEIAVWITVYFGGIFVSL